MKVYAINCSLFIGLGKVVAALLQAHQRICGRFSMVGVKNKKKLFCHSSLSVKVYHDGLNSSLE